MDTQTTTTTNKKRKRQVYSTVPIKLPKNSNNTQAFLLLQFPQDNAQLSFSGETGIVGRLYKQKQNHDDITVDVKGKIFKGKLAFCNTAMVLNVAADQAKVEHVTQFFMPLQEIAAEFNTETVLEGGDGYKNMNQQEQSDDEYDVNT